MWDMSSGRCQGGEHSAICYRRLFERQTGTAKFGGRVLITSGLSYLFRCAAEAAFK